MDREFWRTTLKQIPQRPGVYLFRDEEGTIIYVGKAENLKSRVSSYFQNSRHLHPKTVALRERARSVETIVVDSPTEALLLECNLIKLHRPHYNVLLKDDKTYPYLKITWQEEYPRLLVVRQLKDDGGRYFGPYSDVGAMNETLELVRNLFPLRNCGYKPGRIKGRPCLNYDIGSCPAPCVGKISKEDYRAVVKKAEQFLAGDGNAVKTFLQEQMAAASAALEFEQAALYRDKIAAIDATLAKQKISSPMAREDRDFVAIARDGEDAVVTVFFVRGGKMCGRESQELARSGDATLPALYALFLVNFYQGDRYVPPEIIVAALPDEEEVLHQILREKRGGRVQFTVPQRGAKARMLALASQNGELLLEERRRRKKESGEEGAKALEQLRSALSLPATPHRIECYDISHIQGAYTVGSMIVFQGGVAQKSEYRKFTIKTVAGVDDFASLQEVVSRRFKRGLAEREDGKSEGFAHLPDLVIIDGGRGQLNAVLPVRDALAPAIPFVALAKREEELMLPEREEPLLLPINSPAYHLIQRIRDEAHRFAITFHRQLRGKGQTKSVLDDIPGIGPKRRKALLKHFGSVKNIAKAGADELALVETMNQEVATTVYDYFRLKEK